MKGETKIYSEFIKRNKVKTTKCGYLFNGQEVRIYKCEGSKFWYSELHQENCYSKKAAIYYCLKNRFNVVNGLIATP